MRNFKVRKDCAIITFSLSEIDEIMRLKFKAIKCNNDIYSVDLAPNTSFHICYLINDPNILKEIRTSKEKEALTELISDTEIMYANNEIDRNFLQDTYKSCSQIIVVLSFNDDHRLIGTSMQCSESQYIFEELIILQGNDYNYFCPIIAEKYPNDFEELQEKYLELLKRHEYVD